jgi:hypothetical protein
VRRNEHSKKHRTLKSSGKHQIQHKLNSNNHKIGWTRRHFFIKKTLIDSTRKSSKISFTRKEKEREKGEHHLEADKLKKLSNMLSATGN